MPAMKKRLLILQQRDWGMNVGHPLAVRFARDGWTLAAITFKKSTDEFVRRQNDVPYAEVMSHDAIYENNSSGEHVDLDTVCEDLGVPSVWPLLRAMRNQVYSYAEKYYFSFRQGRTDDESTAYLKAAYVALSGFLDRFRPDFILGPNFVSLPQIMIGLLAARRGASMVTMTDTKISGIFTFANSHNLDRGGLLDRIDALNAGEAETINREEAREYIRQFRHRFVQPAHAQSTHGKPTLRETVRGEFRPFFQIYEFLRHRRTNRVGNLGITIDYKPPRIILRDHWAYKRYRAAAERRTYYPLERMPKMVYFPLQVQPEAVIDQLAPVFSNQIETARQLALALPGNFTLAVKEHPWMVGRRPPSYHEKLARLPNVKLVDFRLSSERMLKQAAVVVSPGGTTLAEAAFYRKPGLQIGNIGLTQKLPNVIRHTDMTTLPDLLVEILSRSLGGAEYERRLENYIAAVLDVGFRLDLSGLLAGNGRNEDFDRLYALYLLEFARLSPNDGIGSQRGQQPVRA